MAFTDFAFSRRARWMVIILVALFLMPLIARADDIKNNIDAGVEAMALAAGGSTGATSFYVVPTNGDGKNGCNLTGSTTLVVAVNSSNPSVASVSPTSLTFDSCRATPGVTVTPLAAGSTTISLTQTSNNTGGTFNLLPATFTVNVTAAAPANSAPVVTITGVADGASYEHGAVPSAGCRVEDAEDGTSTFAATLGSITGPLASYGLGTREASCAHTDSGGLSGAASATYTIVDTVAPTLTLPGNPGHVNATATSALGAVVNYTVGATDAVDPNPVVACTPVSGSQFPLGTTTVSCTASDVAGNTGRDNLSVHVHYARTGALDPINADGGSIFKAGSTVPVKFRLTGDSSGIPNASASITVQRFSSVISGWEEEVVVSTAAATSGNAFRYDSANDQYIFNLGTKGMAAGSYRLTINYGDGTTYQVNFSLRK